MLDLDSTANYAENPTENSTTSQDSERKREQRRQRQGALTVGDEFRPYDLFDEYGIIPAKLMACKILTPGEKLAWVDVAKRLGRVGDCFPGHDTLGEDLGVDGRQVQRWLKGLEKKHFLRIIPRFVPGRRERTSNEYRLLWHSVFEEDTRGSASDNLSSRHDNLSSPGGDNLSGEKSQSLKREKEKTKATSSDDDAAAQINKPKTLTQTEPGLWQYQQQIAKALKARSCVTSSFRKGDKDFAASLFRDGVPIEDVHRGICLACWRWYGTSLNGNVLPLIGSLRYFTNAIKEVAATDGGSGYWEHVEHRVCQFEKTWLNQRKTPASESAPAEREGWFDAQIDQLIREQEASSSARADDQRKPPAREPAQPEAVSGFAY